MCAARSGFIESVQELDDSNMKSSILIAITLHPHRVKMSALCDGQADCHSTISYCPQSTRPHSVQRYLKVNSAAVVVYRSRAPGTARNSDTGRCTAQQGLFCVIEFVPGCYRYICCMYRAIAILPFIQRAFRWSHRWAGTTWHGLGVLWSKKFCHVCIVHSRGYIIHMYHT